ncbi:predicted protein [Nematostella vectensis]|uniref:N-acetyltransferase domain-containing protein n=1 Tax=Nematostella vectensis TaxID=45351 RepID=A7S2Y3_NEMVE|nr:uncharacterized protein F36G3.2 [Nematostella vectensis]EDO41907.1 predicted protein [Nematostella vectensis]|eukprot:XP_001633970.1 predicted protein [Nematostella vectensis]
MLQVRSVRPDESGLLSYILRLIDGEKWRVCSNTCECLLLIDPTSVFVGELNGKPIGSVVFLKYGESYCFVSTFIIDPEYRGNGYGKQLFNTAMKAASPPPSMALCSVDAMVPNYKRLGFEPLWRLNGYDVEVKVALLQTLKREFTTSSYHAETVDESKNDVIINYDTKVFGHERKDFLKYFIRSCNGLARMASDSGGSIVGYLATREAYNKEYGYVVGPLYADSIDVAAVLLISIVEAILDSGSQEVAPRICMLSPVGGNPEAKRLIDLMGGELQESDTFCATNGKLQGCVRKWFAITGGNLG